MPNNYGFRLIPEKSGGFRLECTAPARTVRHSPAGTALRAEFRRVYDEGHNAHYVKEKDVDAYARIQSFMDECSIDNLIRRFKNGDQMALERSQGFFGDFGDMNLDARAVYDIDNKARRIFDGLSEAQKAQFGNDYASFLGNLGTDQGLESFVQQLVKKDAPTDTAQEVTEDAQ